MSQSIVTPVSRPGAASVTQHEIITSALTNYAHIAGGVFEQNGRNALAAYLQQLQETTHIQYYFFMAQGHRLDAPFVANEVSTQTSKLILQAMRENKAEVSKQKESTLLAQPVVSAHGTHYVLVAMMDSELWEQPYFPPRTRFWRLLAAIFTAGAVCYWLARNIAAPVVKLRAVTRQLAAGDLAARIGPAMGKRRDELADLGRDFDLMAERIESLMVSQRQLLADISHELRSPLARLNLALGLAHRHAGPSASAALCADLDRIEREAERLNELIGQLLVLARLESGAAGTQHTPVNLAQLVQEVAADADFEARSNGRGVRVAVSQECWTAGNAELLRSAVENVVRNAIRYTKEDTTVEVSLTCRQEAESNQEQAIITVRDWGSGVPETALANLFRPFYRVAEARDRQSGGAGLGLAITERAVRSYGGHVTATNAPGGGLQVELCLPATTQMAAMPH
ncbi:MAG: HAMP domain-containing protein [Abitibacteriaceae bacterium]|nr:HAMP domain-containing protein [Abditibacteriaceae bacterium]